MSYIVHSGKNVVSVFYGIYKKKKKMEELKEINSKQKNKNVYRQRSPLINIITRDIFKEENNKCKIIFPRGKRLSLSRLLSSEKLMKNKKNT